MNSKMERIKYNLLNFLCNVSKTPRLKRNLTKAELKRICSLTLSQAICGRTEKRRQQMHSGECIYPPATTELRDQYLHQFLAIGT